MSPPRITLKAHVPDRRSDPNAPLLSRMLQIRLTDELYKFVAYEAHVNGVTVSHAIRALIDEGLDNRTAQVEDDDGHIGAERPLREMLAVVDLDDLGS